MQMLPLLGITTLQRNKMYKKITGENRSCNWRFIKVNEKHALKYQRRVHVRMSTDGELISFCVTDSGCK